MKHLIVLACAAIVLACILQGTDALAFTSPVSPVHPEGDAHAFITDPVNPTPTPLPVMPKPTAKPRRTNHVAPTATPVVVAQEAPNQSVRW